MNKSSIVFVASHVPAGGVEQIWRDLAQAFRENGHDVELLALQRIPESGGDGQATVPWVTLLDKKSKSPLAACNILWSLVRHFRRRAPDYLISAHPAANVIAPLAIKLAGVATKVIITHHSPVDTYDKVLNTADSLIGSLDLVSSIVSVSNAVRDSLKGKPDRYLQKTTRIYNALPPNIENFISDLKAHRKPRDSKSRKIIATGRLTLQKNYPLLIRAAAFVDAEIHIVGAGPDEAELKALAAELGVSEKITFWGHQERLRTLELLSESDIFVQPSLFEGHSLGLIEAAKSGLPLVVSTFPVQLEAITAPDGTRCGIAVDPDDAKQFAAELTKLLDDPSHYALWSERAQRLASASHFDVMFRQYEALLWEQAQSSELKLLWG